MRLFPRNPARKSERAAVLETAPARPELVRRYEITVEREFLAAWNHADQPFTAFCPQCEGNVAMLPPESAAAVAGTTTRNVYRWVEEHRVHFLEPTAGSLLVCCDSLRELSRSAASCATVSELSTLDQLRLPAPPRSPHDE